METFEQAIYDAAEEQVALQRRTAEVLERLAAMLDRWEPILDVMMHSRRMQRGLRNATGGNEA
jgi:hypothetical protein